jgi:NAD(P)-dependent dehydrogenase (short-subunit alcohol dehydrogenase family)/acyl carrier protein
MITGGFGRVGVVLAESLAREHAARLSLVARGALPGREAWSTWLASHADDDATSTRIRTVQRLESLGAEVLVVACDVADAAGVARAIDATIARFGALHGVVHAAGLPTTDVADSTIAELGDAACDAQLLAKVQGTRALAEALEGRALDFVVLMSSLASVLGGLGFAAYASANAYLDAFARVQSAKGVTPWIAIGWDAWNVGHDARDGAAFGAELQQLALSADDGVEAFERILGVASSIDHVLVSTADLGARIDKWVARTPARASTDGAAHARPELATPYVAPTNDVEETIAQIWRELLGFEQVGIHDDFLELGGHSLLAMQVVTRIRKAFHLDLPIRAFMDAQTVSNLADVVVAQRARSAAPADLEAILAQLEAMPDDQIEQLLER